MPSLRDSRDKIEIPKAIIIERLLLFLLFIGWVGLTYTIWSVYYESIIIACIYLFLLLILTGGIFLIFVDLYEHLREFQETNDKEGIVLLRDSHFLCANPLCSRCGGWYWGLGFTTTIILAIHQKILEMFQRLQIHPIILVSIGFLIFLVSTPIHGASNFLLKIPRKSFNYIPNKIKLILGFISGLSIS